MTASAAEIDGSDVKQDDQVTFVENGKPLDSVAVSTSQVHSRKTLPPGLTWKCCICSILWIILITSNCDRHSLLVPDFMSVMFATDVCK